jgi:hypothetical protein
LIKPLSLQELKKIMSITWYHFSERLANFKILIWASVSGVFEFFFSISINL